MNRTELRYLYACLLICADKLGDMGCNDWRVASPNVETLAFMQSCEDTGSEPRKLETARNVYGWNFGPPQALIRKLEALHGKEMFIGCDKLVDELT